MVFELLLSLLERMSEAAAWREKGVTAAQHVVFILMLLNI